MGKKQIYFKENDQLYMVRNQDGALDVNSIFATRQEAGKHADDSDIVTIVPNDWIGVESEIMYNGIGYNTLAKDGELFDMLINRSGLSTDWFTKHFGKGHFSRAMLSYYRNGKKRVPYMYKQLMRNLVISIEFTFREWRESNVKR